MTFKDDNKAYEAWLKQQCNVVPGDLAIKHEKMRESAFVFLRGTYFRWARIIEKQCKELADAPAVLAVGDLHIENYGTWRDIEGRLVWGINDFDEAARMPYAFDLVRLVTSARLAPGMRIADSTIAEAVLAGYQRGIAKPRPTLLDEHETWMRQFVGTTDAERERFWKKIQKLPGAKRVHPAIKRTLEKAYPERAATLRYAKRIAGVGSLGRPRIVGVAEWRGGHIVREAKSLVPSAWLWAHNKTGRSRFVEAVHSTHRSPDPYLSANDRFVVRRLAADTSKIEFEQLPRRALQRTMYEAMGFELGAFHGANGDDAEAILRDLDRRGRRWVHKAADRAVAATRRDYKEWRRGR